jgi:hypothetical protein
MTAPPEKAGPNGDWRIVTLARSPGDTFMPAMLINQQTGETWRYDYVNSGSWQPVKRVAP